jgi:protein phosphatase
MASGQSRPLAVDTAFSEMLARAFNGEYTTVDQFNNDLKAIRDGREVGLKISFSFGQATEAGRVRPANQDSAIVLPMIRLQESQMIATALCIVADGMGGQESGERAAKIAYKTIAAEINTQLIMPALQGEVTQKLYATPGEILKEAVAKANRKVYEVAHQQRINMGTTVTAALLEGPRAYIVNVGDSRTYRLRNGALANLVQAGAITEEEVYTHPNRNQIFRSLGDKPEVEVDLFPIDLKKDDQLMLCSDGLWEMVRDPQIRDILVSVPDPQTACEALVRAAYDAGGEDNITVIVARVN